MRPGRRGGSAERELSGPVTGDPLAREPNGSSPAAASQRALHRRSSPRYSIPGLATIATSDRKVARPSNGGPSGEGAERIFASRRESTRSTPPVEPEVFDPWVGNNRDFRPPGVRSDGAGRPLGGARRSCPPDPALVVVPGHLCPSPNGSDCGGNIRSRI